MGTVEYCLDRLRRAKAPFLSCGRGEHSICSIPTVDIIYFFSLVVIGGNLLALRLATRVRNENPRKFTPIARGLGLHSGNIDFCRFRGEFLDQASVTCVLMSTFQ